MKYNKIIGAAVFLSFFMTGCSSDGEVINTVSVSVGFEETALSIKETVEFVTLPIVIGDDVPRDGDVVVHATMKSFNGAFELDKEVIITTETLRIPPGLDRIDFEVALNISTPGRDAGRNMEFQITDARGATIGSNNTCRIDVIETHFVEGRYEIEGKNPLYDRRETGAFLLSTADGTLNEVMMDFGIGSKARMTFTEVKPEEEYDIEIDPFQFLGLYNGLEVYITWIRATRQDTDPDTTELINGLYLDRTRPVRGKFYCTVQEGRATRAVFKMTDGFALLGHLGATYGWFNVFEPGAEITKDQ